MAIELADTTDPATATSGDVRGTVRFGLAPDGIRRYSLLMDIRNNRQYDRAFGVKQYVDEE